MHKSLDVYSSLIYFITSSASYTITNATPYKIQIKKNYQYKMKLYSACVCLLVQGYSAKWFPALC